MTTTILTAFMRLCRMLRILLVSWLTSFGVSLQALAQEKVHYCYIEECADCSLVIDRRINISEYSDSKGTYLLKPPGSKKKGHLIFENKPGKDFPGYRVDLDLKRERASLYKVGTDQLLELYYKEIPCGLLNKAPNQLLDAQTKKYFPRFYRDLPIPPKVPRASVAGTTIVSSVTMEIPFEEAIEFYKNFFNKQGGSIANPYSETEKHSFVVKRSGKDGVSPDDLRVEFFKFEKNTRIVFSYELPK